MNLFFVPWWVGVFLASCFCLEAAETYSVASYNLDNYRIQNSAKRKRRSEESRAVAAKAILVARPDIIGLRNLVHELH